MRKLLKILDRPLDLIAMEINWWVYCAGTQDERLRYEYGLIKGFHCTRRIMDIHGRIIGLEYDINRTPEREYLTKEEYFKTKRYEK